MLCMGLGPLRFQMVIRINLHYFLSDWARIMELNDINIAKVQYQPTHGNAGYFIM